jgi:hypothetical protein
MRGAAALLVALVLTIAAPAPAALDDACAPTAADHPLRALVDRINDPEAGAELRTAWSIDRALWVEPSCVTDASGTLRLVAPAHADIHASMATAGAEWNPDDSRRIPRSRSGSRGPTWTT